MSKWQIKACYEERHRRAESEAGWRPREWHVTISEHLNTNGGRLIDVGCGTGRFLEVMKSRGLECHGIDFSKEAVKVAKKNTRSEILVGDGEKLPYVDNCFDYVTVIGSLEHFKHVNKGMREMVRISKDGAKFLIIVPNFNYLFYLLKEERGTIQREISEHLFTLNGWKTLLEHNGLSIDKIFQDTYFSYLARARPLLDKNPFSFVEGIIKKIVWFFMPITLTYLFVFVCSKRSIGAHAAGRRQVFQPFSQEIRKKKLQGMLATFPQSIGGKQTMVSNDIKQKLKFFLGSLDEENETLALTLSDLLQSKLLALREVNEKVVGVAGIRDRNLFYVVAKKNWQDRGIGQELTRKIVFEAVKRNYNYVALNVSSSNAKAVHIYQKFGFKAVYSYKVKGKKILFMILPINWKGTIARNVFLVSHLLRSLKSIVQNKYRYK